MVEILTTPKPDWLKVNFNSQSTKQVASLMANLKLNTVCKEANCPNLGECYKNRTATFMILGSRCTRNCTFCNVSFGEPEKIDDLEPRNLAIAAKHLGLRHIVITSVTRDDLPDGGASQFARVIEEIRKELSSATIEVLIPDFKGNEGALNTVLNAMPDVLNHNLETVKSLYSRVRPQANYIQSLELLMRAKEFSLKNGGNMVVKTGIMVGLGETEPELVELFEDAVEYGVDVLTIGQYLQPSKRHFRLERYVTPEEFNQYGALAEKAGILYVTSSPLVRSSYKADEAFRTVLEKRKL